MRTTRTLTRVLLLLLLCLLFHRLTGTEVGTVGIVLVAMLPITLLPAYPALLLCAWTRDRIAAVMALTIIAAHLAICLPRMQAVPISEQARSAPSLRVAAVNLYLDNPDPERAGRFLRTLEADLLVISELTQDALPALRRSGLTQDLPYVAQIPGTGPETTGLFSRLPLDDVELELFSGRGYPQATVTVGGLEVRLLGFHVQPAISVFERPWRTSFRRLSEHVEATDLPVILAGDLNAGLDSGPMRELLSTGLRDASAERGKGLVRTWPAAFPLLGFDHVLVRDGDRARLEVLDVSTPDVPGSDHKAVVATIAVVGQARASR